MTWIKRNLFFVLGIVIGVLLMGGAGYFLYGNLQENAGLTDEFKAKVAELKTLQNKSPSDENIAAAKEQQKQLRAFLGEFKNVFAPPPALPKTDEKGFRSYLAKTISDLQTEAAEAGVSVTNQSFSFSALHSAQGDRVNYSISSIAPWMEQLAEIKAICEVLYRAKVNALEGLRRVKVSADDPGGADYLSASATTNQLGVIAPYEVSFRGFSAEIAVVLDGFLHSSNCFVVKSIDISPSKFVPLASLAGMPMSANPIYYPVALTRQIPRNVMVDRYGGAAEAAISAGNARSPVPVAQVASPLVFRQPATTGPLVTILSERPLHVTISVEVVKFKTSN